MHIREPVFIRFSCEFIRIVWHVKAVFLTLIAMTVIGAVIIAIMKVYPWAKRFTLPV
jgi:hypothetical protein